MKARPDAYVFAFPAAVQWLGYGICWLLLRGVMLCTIRVHLARPFPKNVPPGCLLACNHGSHLDPHAISLLLPRRVDWISRVEFFKSRTAAFLLHLVGAIPVHRQGIALGAIKTAIRRVKSGKTVGICPEGEVMRGETSILRGGSLKRGAGLIAVRTAAPVVPCTILGLDAMRRVEPWLPMRRGQIWLSFGEPLYPRQDLPGKAAREELTIRLEAELRCLAAELLQKYDLPAESRP